MAVLKIKCNNQTLEWVKDPAEMYAGNINIDSISFSFCELWEGYAKTAVFYRNTKEVYSVLLNDSNTCLIPPEVTEENGIVYVGVFGIKGECRRTTGVKSFYLKESVLIEGKPSDPTPDIYQQIINLCTEATNIAKSVREAADSGEFKGDKGDMGYTPQRGIDYWTEIDKKEIEGYIDKKMDAAEAELIAGADAVIEPVLSGVTERLVFNSILPGIKYQVFAGETPFTSELCNMDVSITTARLGFEGDGITVRFYEDNGEYVCTMAIEVISTINEFKLCRLREV